MWMYFLVLVFLEERIFQQSEFQSYNRLDFRKMEFCRVMVWSKIVLNSFQYFFLIIHQKELHQPRPQRIFSL